jgi:hypothetical protein
LNSLHPLNYTSIIGLYNENGPNWDHFLTPLNAFWPVIFAGLPYGSV